MTVVRRIIDHALRTLGTQAGPRELWEIEQRVLEALRGEYGNGPLRFYVAQASPAERAERIRKLGDAARERKATPAQIAQQFGVSVQHVRRLRRGGTS